MKKIPLMSAQYYKIAFYTRLVIASVFALFATSILTFTDTPQNAGLPFIGVGVILFMVAHSRKKLNQALEIEDVISKEVEEYMETRPHVDSNFRSERSGKTIKEMTEEYEKEHDTKKDDSKESSS